MLRALATVLLLLVIALGWQLVFGNGGRRAVAQLAAQVAAQRAENARLQARNDALAAEVADLKQGEAALEERARTELGLIREGEVFYRVVDEQADAGAEGDVDADVRE